MTTFLTSATNPAAAIRVIPLATFPPLLPSFFSVIAATSAFFCSAAAGGFAGVDDPTDDDDDDDGDDAPLELIRSFVSFTPTL